MATKNSSTKHTTTPWSYERARIHFRIRGGMREIGVVPFVGHRSGVGRDKVLWTSEADAVHIVKCVNAHDDLVAALRECERELRLTNLTQDGEQKAGTPAARVIESARAMLAKVQS